MEEKEKSVLQSARANSDWMRRPPGHLITGGGREETMRTGGGEELVAASKQFRRSCGEKSSRLGFGLFLSATAAAATVGIPTQVLILGIMSKGSPRLSTVPPFLSSLRL